MYQWAALYHTVYLIAYQDYESSWGCFRWNFIPIKSLCCIVFLFFILNFIMLFWWLFDAARVLYVLRWDFTTLYGIIDRSVSLRILEASLIRLIVTANVYIPMRYNKPEKLSQKCKNSSISPTESEIVLYSSLWQPYTWIFYAVQSLFTIWKRSHFN